MFLVLSRKPGEGLTFSHKDGLFEPFTVNFERVSGDRMTVAIGAPQEIHVLRTELIEQEQSGGQGDGLRRAS